MRAFSSEVDTGLLEENASKLKNESLGFDFIKAGKALDIHDKTIRRYRRSSLLR